MGFAKIASIIVIPGLKSMIPDAGIIIALFLPNPTLPFSYFVREKNMKRLLFLLPLILSVQLFAQSPDYLIWIGPTAGSEAASSATEIKDAAISLGDSAIVSRNLFIQGADLSIYQAIFVVLGVKPGNHTIFASDSEGPALASYLQDAILQV
ncbi:MAG: hypothetical protein AAFP70_22105 [Calditrichota bacterium]